MHASDTWQLDAAVRVFPPHRTSRTATHRCFVSRPRQSSAPIRALTNPPGPHRKTVFTQPGCRFGCIKTSSCAPIKFSQPRPGADTTWPM